MTSATWPWPAGAATGIGSLPGTDIVDAVKLVMGELPALPHLPELPARGAGAEMIGRGAAFLPGLPVELYAGRWRVTARAGRDLRRALDLLDRDLDALTAAAAGYTGPLKLQATGAWTLAAGIDLPIGGRLLRDHGATRDLVASLAEGLRSHVEDVARRVPGATLLLQLDEPSLPAVLTGHVPNESGLYTLRAVPEPVMRDGIRSIVEAVGVPVILHSCAPDVPVTLLREAGAAAIAFDLSLFGDRPAGSRAPATRPSTMDALGEAIDAGVGLLVGAVPTAGPRVPAAVDVASSVIDLWHRLGFAAPGLAGQVVVTPACGLAEATPEYARSALAVCVETGKRLFEHANG